MQVCRTGQLPPCYFYEANRKPGSCVQLGGLGLMKTTRGDGVRFLLTQRDCVIGP